MHYRKIHHDELRTVPNAKEDRKNPADGMHVYGMVGVPDEMLAKWGIGRPEFESMAPDRVVAAAPAKPPPSMAKPEPAGGGPALSAQLALWLAMNAGSQRSEPAVASAASPPSGLAALSQPSFSGGFSTSTAEAASSHQQVQPWKEEQQQTWNDQQPAWRDQQNQPWKDQQEASVAELEGQEWAPRFWPLGPPVSAAA